MLFDRTICIEGNRRDGRRIVASGVPACVVDDGVPSDAVDAHLVASCDRFTFFIRRGEWTEVEPPQIGDFVTVADGEARYAVTRVATLGECYSLNSRSR